MTRDFFWDEEVLKIQNEVRRYKDEQRIHGGDVDDKMQRVDGSGTDSPALPDKSRGDLLQDASAVAQREWPYTVYECFDFRDV